MANRRECEAQLATEEKAKAGSIAETFASMREADREVAQLRRAAESAKAADGMAACMVHAEKAERLQRESDVAAEAILARTATLLATTKLPSKPAHEQQKSGLEVMRAHASVVRTLAASNTESTRREREAAAAREADAAAAATSLAATAAEAERLRVEVEAAGAASSQRTHAALLAVAATQALQRAQEAAEADARRQLGASQALRALPLAESYAAAKTAAAEAQATKAEAALVGTALAEAAEAVARMRQQVAREEADQARWR